MTQFHITGDYETPQSGYDAPTRLSFASRLLHPFTHFASLCQRQKGLLALPHEMQDCNSNQHHIELAND